jgi:hypothetical protein
MATLNHVSELLAQERRQYRLIFGLAFLIILLITPLARLLPTRWRPWPPVGKGQQSLVAEARGVTQRILPFAFL